ncbi:hypothetical protein HJG60_011849 [Phyllostomus discolor]|uniref:Uncharacterized protein n=1 Tax=Phyllostomus discolor TaxID=89673 RepID=A0A834DW01_9CHIR|nr:hypothetical protein HJG60_011849 [Phyllostomus discolor]
MSESLQGHCLVSAISLARLAISHPPASADAAASSRRLWASTSHCLPCPFPMPLLLWEMSLVLLNGSHLPFLGAHIAGPCAVPVGAAIPDTYRSVTYLPSPSLSVFIRVVAVKPSASRAAARTELLMHTQQQTHGAREQPATST